MYSTMTADGSAWPKGVGHNIARHQRVGGGEGRYREVWLEGEVGGGGGAESGRVRIMKKK